MAGQIERFQIGRESPFRDRTLIQLINGQQLGMVCPNIFAMDATPNRLRLTLMGSSIMAHHDPHPGTTGR